MNLAWLNLTGCEGLFGSHVQIAQRITQQVLYSALTYKINHSLHLKSIIIIYIKSTAEHE